MGGRGRENALPADTDRTLTGRPLCYSRRWKINRVTPGTPSTGPQPATSSSYPDSTSRFSPNTTPNFTNLPVTPGVKRQSGSFEGQLHGRTRTECAVVRLSPTRKAGRRVGRYSRGPVGRIAPSCLVRLSSPLPPFHCPFQPREAMGTYVC